jgi:hypothetical protein
MSEISQDYLNGGKPGQRHPKLRGEAEQQKYDASKGPNRTGYGGRVAQVRAGLKFSILDSSQPKE